MGKAIRIKVQCGAEKYSADIEGGGGWVVGVDKACCSDRKSWAALVFKMH